MIRRSGRSWGALVAGSVVAIIVAGCGGGDDGDSAAPSGGPPTTTKAPTLLIERPTDGATLDCPVTIRVKATGLSLLPVHPDGADAGSDARGRPSVQLFAFVDTDPVLSGVVPNRAGIVELERARLRLTEISPGPHTIVVVAAGADRNLLVPDLRARVNFTIGSCKQRGDKTSPPTTPPGD